MKTRRKLAGDADERLAREPWAMWLPGGRMEAVARLRVRADLEAAEVEGNGERVIWLRGCGLDDEVLAMPFEELFRWCQEEGTLFPLQGDLPVSRLPDCGWQKLEEFVTPQPPGPVLPAEPPLGVSLSLERVAAGRPVECNAMLTTLAVWKSFCASALNRRLQKLRFAVCEDGRVLIRGTPVPSLQGHPLVERAGIAVTAGNCWHPPLAPEIVAQSLQLNPGDLAMLQPDGTWEKIAAENFVPASRAAACLTMVDEPGTD